ncbi:hypothetical protein COCMIDRAFT_38402 [Bipolaris oryzae ATCC 44560]|uniref:NACHT domain-containing protein n=1 Tax=Bipolaris oryzae ATCC 44560 TaxID=930090 RepID=W6ZJC3_COCMI|nr:uncharacterized protein COCMIDRAFT_38402 [Bipolaris oryzae ATCC 44560]EUC43671.1 hypothetical protein COCMIDRAFT_38402 [Bipolaris oryzae ATCC 44560]
MATLVVPQSNAFTNLWTEAIAQLPAEHKHGINFAQHEKIDILKDLREKAETSRNQFMVSRWKYTRKSGETVIIRDVLEKFLRWLDVFKEIGDVAVQYDPTHAALPWAGIRFILQVAVNDTNKMSLVIEDLTWISELICRYTILEALYIYDSSAAYEALLRALVKLYSKILLHLSSIIAYFEQGTAKRMIKSALLFDKRFESTLDEIHRAEEQVKHWISLAERNDSIEKNDKLAALLNSMNGPLRRIDRNLEHVQDNLERSERTKILLWLSSEPYMGHHKQVKKDLLPGTGMWLLDDAIFKKWKDDSASSILWLHGIAGSGKSKLVSIVIEDAMKDFQARNSPQPVFFYCSRNPAEPLRSNPRGILASIARQLSNIELGMPLLKPTVDMYKREESQSFSSGQPDMTDICDLITELIEIYPQTMIIIDAMDECDPETRWELLEYLEMILKNASSLVKIFVSSRNDQDIVLQLKNYPNLEINSRMNKSDIARFVKNETEQLVKRRKLLCRSNSRDELKELIISKTTANAHGMFRWASMQLQYLCLFTEDGDIRDAMGRLPPDLREQYNQVYNKLSTIPGDYRQTIFKNALCWLLSARTTLPTDRFLAAVTTIPHEDKKIPISLETILEYCNNFIVHDSQLDTFRFAHLSVREFLEESPQFSKPSCNNMITEACLWIVLCKHPKPTTQKLFRHVGWTLEIEPSVVEALDYAQCYWPTHCRAAGNRRKSGTLSVVLKHLFLDERDKGESSLMALWMRDITAHTVADQSVYMVQQLLIRRCEPSSSSPSQSFGLFIACAFDFEELGKELFVSEALTVPYTTVRGESIGDLAVENGSFAILSHLVSQKEFGITLATKVLKNAAPEDCKDIAMILVDRWKADGQSKSMVLAATVSNIPLEAVEVLLDSWEDVDITQGMILAALRRNDQSVEITKLLLSSMRENARITQEMVEEAIKNDKNTLRLAQVLQSQGRNEAWVEPDKLDTKTERSHKVVGLIEQLLDELGEDITITENTLRAVIFTSYNPRRLIECFLRRRRKDLPIAASVVKYILKGSPEDVALVLLKDCDLEGLITKENIEIVASRRDGAKRLMLLFANQRGDLIDMLLNGDQKVYRTEDLGRNLHRIQLKRSREWICCKRKDDGWVVK